MKKLFFIRMLALLLALAPLAGSAQCVMCKTQVVSAQAENDEYEVGSLNRGILYMMTVPYLLIGGIGYFWYRRTHPRPAKKPME